jgi:NTE family protein
VEVSDVGAATWVFGGGGVGAIAWETGVLAGLQDEGVDLSGGLLLGTSAGAVVAARLAAGGAVDDLYERQRRGVAYEVPKRLSARMILTMTRYGLLSRSAPAFGRQIGAAAVAFGQDEADVRRRVVEARLDDGAGREWTHPGLHLVVVDADTGVHRVLTRSDGVPLVDAVMASCAIPLVWPTVPIDGHRYMDGGMRSPVNLDLAPGPGPVVALAATTRWQRWARLSDQRNALGNRGVTVLTMSPGSRRAQGRNPLNLDTVPAVAAAGRHQARADARKVLASLRD